MGTKVAVVDLKGISKPLTKLIESVSKAVGRLYNPADTILQAHADAKASLIRAKGKEAEKKLVARASVRHAFIESRRQKNIDAIVANAARELPPSVSTTAVDEDWLANFFEYSKDIANEQL